MPPACHAAIFIKEFAIASITAVSDVVQHRCLTPIGRHPQAFHLQDVQRI